MTDTETEDVVRNEHKRFKDFSVRDCITRALRKINPGIPEVGVSEIFEAAKNKFHNPEREHEYLLFFIISKIIELQNLSISRGSYLIEISRGRIPKPSRFVRFFQMWRQTARFNLAKDRIKWRAYMKDQEGLPNEALDYLSLMRKTFNAYHDIKSHEEYVLMIGKEEILEVSHFPQYLMMEAADPLPPGFERRIYQFREKSIGGGIIDVVFKGDVLANIRAQIFFRGFFAKKKAKKYLRNTLLPEFKSIFGEPYDSSPYNYWFKSSGIIGTACYVPGTPSASFYLIDEKYA